VAGEVTRQYTVALDIDTYIFAIPITISCYNISFTIWIATF